MSRIGKKPIAVPTGVTVTIDPDVVRLDKGHTEGLEPRVTEELIKMIAAASGGKARSAGM